MFNQAFFIRVLLAAVGAVLAIAIIPAFLRVIGFPVSGDLMLIIKVVIAAVAVFYVIKGT